MNLREMKVIYQNYLKTEMAIQLIKMLSPLDIIMDVFADGKIFTEYRNLKRLDKFMIPANMIKYIYNTRTCTEDIINLLQTNQLHIEKINMFFQNMDIRNKTEEMLKKVPEISVTSSLNSNMEINNNNANKGSGLRWLTKHLNLQMNQVMALGDSDNDMDMLKAAGLAVAMENGTAAIKSIADYVTLSNEENGVSEAIRMVI